MFSQLMSLSRLSGHCAVRKRDLRIINDVDLSRYFLRRLRRCHGPSRASAVRSVGGFRRSCASDSPKRRALWSLRALETHTARWRTLALALSLLGTAAIANNNRTLLCEESRTLGAEPNRQSTQTAAGDESPRETRLGKVVLAEKGYAPVHLLMTNLRDMNTKAAEFRSSSTRLLNLLLELTFCELPVTETETFISPGGFKFPGVSLKSTVRICLLPLITENDGSSSFFQPVLQRIAHHSVEKGSLTIAGQKAKEQSGSLHVKQLEIAKEASQCHVIILLPEIFEEEKLVLGIEKLRGHGVETEKIWVTSLLANRKVIERLHKHYPRLNFLTGSLDFFLDADGRNVPGFGSFYHRFLGLTNGGSAKPWRRFLLFGPRTVKVKD